MSSYLQQWNAMFQDQQSQQKNMADIELYYELETAAYEKILQDTKQTWQGTFKELQEALGFQNKPIIFVGFLEGLNNSLKEKINLEELADDSALNLNIDFEKLFIAMHEAKADWLYKIKAWDEIISPQQQQEMLYEWRQSKIARSDKIGRNDPCPCGSGKKYKKCCGKN